MRGQRRRPAAISIPPELSDEIAAQLLIIYVTSRMTLRGLRKSVPENVVRDGVVLVSGAGTVVAPLLLHALSMEVRVGRCRGEFLGREIGHELVAVEVDPVRRALLLRQPTRPP